VSISDWPEDDDRTRIEHDTDDAQAPSGDAPAWIGPYRLLELLGSGGMGEVYLAQQSEPVERKVAIKLIRGAQRQSISRAMFEVERALLARMQHPYIAQVLDAGETDQGRPWFAMEWVRGEPILEYCDQNGLDAAARLALFLRVCQGVQHAHQRGILHRDLKPANILVSAVDGRHWPKIIDFGVATSLLEETAPDRAVRADRAGTLAYMSPEQMAGGSAGLDTRTDVYALGILLFELLTGLRPLIERSSAALTSFCEVLQTRQIPLSATQEPRFSPEAAAAARALPLELRWIIARAIAPERERRYVSAAAVAEDVNRYLCNRPVEAVPQTAGYRLRKFVSRHRLPVAAGSMIAVALVAGLGLAAWGLTQARAERDRAQIEAERAAQTARFVQNIFRSVDPVRAEGYDTALLRQLLDEASERAALELTDQPQVLADIQYTFGLAYRSIGELHRGREQLASAVALSKQAGPLGVHLAASVALANLEHNFAEYEAALARSRHILERLAGAPVNDPALRVGAINAKAGALQYLLRLGEAEVLLLEAVNISEGANENNLIGERLEALRGLAQVYSDGFRFEPAIATYEQALAETRAWSDPRAVGALVSLLNDLAVTYLRRQQYAEAEPLLREALERGEELYGPDHPALLTSISNLAGSLRQQGRAEEALPLYQRARKRIHALHGPDHPMGLSADFNFGNGLRDVGRIDEALGLHRDVLERGLRLTPDDRFRIGMFRLGLGRSAHEAGLPAEAQVVLELAVADLEATAGADFHRTLEARELLAQVEARLALGEHRPDATPDHPWP